MHMPLISGTGFLLVPEVLQSAKGLSYHQPAGPQAGKAVGDNCLFPQGKAPPISISFLRVFCQAHVPTWLVLFTFPFLSCEYEFYPQPWLFLSPSASLVTSQVKIVHAKMYFWCACERWVPFLPTLSSWLIFLWFLRFAFYKSYVLWILSSSIMDFIIKLIFSNIILIPLLWFSECFWLFSWCCTLDIIAS